MTLAHTLGFPRIGARRELKHAQEAYWRGETTAAELAATGKILRRRHWQVQADAGLDLIPVGEFSWYDHLLDLSTLLGVVPPRFGWTGGEVDLDTYFRMARGRAPCGSKCRAPHLRLSSRSEAARRPVGWRDQGDGRTTRNRRPG